MKAIEVEGLRKQFDPPKGPVAVDDDGAGAGRDGKPGEVVVEAPNGVELERWIPVFMYASLS